jgi:hypothetical protein
MNGQKGLRESCQLISNQVMVETDQPPGESSARPWPGAPGLTTNPMVSLTEQIGEPHQSQPNAHVNARCRGVLFFLVGNRLERTVKTAAVTYQTHCHQRTTRELLVSEEFLATML